MTSISDTLNRFFDRIDNLPQAPLQAPPQAPPQAPLPNPENANNTTSDFLSFDDSSDDNIPPPLLNRNTSGDDCDSVPRASDNNHTNNEFPTASPVQQIEAPHNLTHRNQALGMMPVQYVRLSDLDGVLNTRNSDLVFPTFHPSSNLFHVWQSAALRKINNHHRLG